MLTKAKFEEMKIRNDEIPEALRHETVTRLIETALALYAVKDAAEEFLNSLQPQNFQAYEEWKPLQEALRPFTSGEREG